MSAASLRVLKGQIQRGFATLATIDAWQAKGAVTAAEADEARAYWHELNDTPAGGDSAAEAGTDAAPATDGA